MDFFDLGHRADVAGHAGVDFGAILALQLEQVSDPEGLACVADVELGVLRHGSSMDAEDAELADKCVNRDLEDVGQALLLRIRSELHRFLTALKRRRVCLGRVRHQLGDDIHQLTDASAAFAGGEAHRHEMAFAKRLLECLMKLLGSEVFAMLEVEFHQGLVNLDHLFHDVGVGLFDAREVHFATGRAEEAIDHVLTAAARQIDRQALLAERFGHLPEQTLDIDVVSIDLVDHDHLRESTIAGGLQHTVGRHFDTGAGVNHHRNRLHCHENRQRSTEEVGIARGVDEVDVLAVEVGTGDRGRQGVSVLFLFWLEVTHHRAPSHVAHRGDRTGLQQHRLHEGGLAAATVAYQGHVADVLGCVFGHRCSSIYG